MLTNNLSWAQVGGYLQKIVKNDGHYRAWRLASIGIVGFLGLAVIFTIYFIYNNIYNTLSNSNVILILSNSPQSDTIDVDAYEKAKEIIAKKEQITSIPIKLRNIFIYDESNTKPPNTTTTTSK